MFQRESRASQAARGRTLFYGETTKQGCFSVGFAESKGTRYSAPMQDIVMVLQLDEFRGEARAARAPSRASASRENTKANMLISLDRARRPRT